MALNPHYSQIMPPPTSKVAGRFSCNAHTCIQLHSAPLSALSGLPFRAIPCLIRVPRIPRRPLTSARRGINGGLSQSVGTICGIAYSERPGGSAIIPAARDSHQTPREHFGTVQICIRPNGSLLPLHKFCRSAPLLRGVLTSSHVVCDLQTCTQ